MITAVTITAIALGILCTIAIAYCVWQRKQIDCYIRELKTYEETMGDFNDMACKEVDYKKSLQSLQVEIATGEEKLKAVKALAAQAAELEKERIIAEQRQIWNQDLIDLQKAHPLEKYKKEIADLTNQLDLYKKELRIIQEQQKQKQEAEDFNEAHSIHLQDEDLSDIRLIYECSESLKKPSALRKAIWSEYYQKPLQDLRKSLNADKVIGIYKITNKIDGKCYIGQSLDIGDRWQQHVKSGIGVGVISYITNKFYRTLHHEGAENFTFEILESCNKEELDAREKYWIDFFGAKEYGYNSTGGNAKCRLNS